MKIAIIVLAIIGIIAIIWFVSILIMNIVVYILFRYSNDDNHISVQRDTSLYTNVEDKFIALPSVSIWNEFGNKRYITIEISWLKYIFIISYHFKTAEDEEIEAEVRRKIKET